MPKKPTDRLEGVRFEFNEKERELLSRYITTEQMKILVPQIMDIITDPKKLYIIGVIYELATGKDLPFVISGIQDAQEAWAEIQRAIKEAAADVATDIVTDPETAQAVYDPFMGPFGVFNIFLPDFLKYPFGNPQETVENWYNQQTGQGDMTV